jgi:hypothetical protein
VVYDLGFRVKSFGMMVYDLGFRVKDSALKGLGYRV